MIIPKKTCYFSVFSKVTVFNTSTNSSCSCLLHDRDIQWWYDNTGVHLPSCERGPVDNSSSQPGAEGRVLMLLPLGLIYFFMLGCYSTDLLLRPGVNCPALGSISNRTARDMGPDTSKRWHYIIPHCFSKWSLHTPPYKSLIIQKKEAGISRRHCPGMSSPQNTVGDLLLIHHDKHSPSSAASAGPMGVLGVSGYFLPE